MSTLFSSGYLIQGLAGSQPASRPFRMPRAQAAPYRRTGLDAYGHARELLFEARNLLPHACGVLAMRRCVVSPCDKTQRTALRLARRCVTLACISVQSYESWSHRVQRGPQSPESISIWREISDVFDDIAYLDAYLGPDSVSVAPDVSICDVRDASALPVVRGFSDLPADMFD